MRIFTISVGLQDCEWSLAESENGSHFLKNNLFGQQIRLGGKGDQYVPGSDNKTFDGTSCEIQTSVPEESNAGIDVAMFDYAYNIVDTNMLNLNPICQFVDDYEGDELIIVSLSRRFKFLRNILDKKCEVINTFRNYDGDFGCMIRVPYNFEGSVMKAEFELDGSYTHFGIGFDDQNGLKISHNIIKKKDTIDTLKVLLSKKKFNGFRINSKRLLTGTIICLESQVEDVTKFVDNLPENLSIRLSSKGYQIFTIADNTFDEGNEYAVKNAAENLQAEFKDSHIRSAFVWDMKNYPYTFIQQFKFLYIFTLTPNMAIKNIKSN